MCAKGHLRDVERERERGVSRDRALACARGWLPNRTIVRMSTAAQHNNTETQPPQPNVKRISSLSVCIGVGVGVCGEGRERGKGFQRARIEFHNCISQSELQPIARQHYGSLIVAAVAAVRRRRGRRGRAGAGDDDGNGGGSHGGGWRSLPSPEKRATRGIPRTHHTVARSVRVAAAAGAATTTTTTLIAHGFAHQRTALYAPGAPGAPARNSQMNCNCEIG